MTAATTRTPGRQRPTRSRDWEWFWRFLAAVMVVVVAWIVWIAIQISPPEIFLPAAYEAAAKARAAHNAAGLVSGSRERSEAGGVKMPHEETSPHVPPHSPPIDPPVNIDKLKFSETLETSPQSRPKRAGKSADGSQ